MIDVPRGEHNLSHSRDTPPVCALAHNKQRVTDFGASRPDPSRRRFHRNPAGAAPRVIRDLVLRRNLSTSSCAPRGAL